MPYPARMAWRWSVDGEGCPPKMNRTVHDLARGLRMRRHGWVVLWAQPAGYGSVDPPTRTRRSGTLATRGATLGFGEPLSCMHRGCRTRQNYIAEVGW